MKKLHPLILAPALAALTLLAAAPGTTQPPRAASSVYPAAMVVTDVTETSPDEYAVTVQTMTGHEYVFFSEDSDWVPGDLAALLMDDNATKEVTDDSIITARYAGYGDPVTW